MMVFFPMGIIMNTLNNALAISDNEITTTSNTVTVGNPFFIVHPKEFGQKNITVNGIPYFNFSFSGNGTVKGIGFIVSNGTGFGSQLSTNILKLNGHGTIISSENKGKSELAFQEISKTDMKGNGKGTGPILFQNSTGNLSFLNDKVAMFKETELKNGTDIVNAWEWDYK